MPNADPTKCPVCGADIPTGGTRCCPPQKPPNPEAHGAKCRRANMRMTPVDAFADPEGYGRRFQAGWIAEDRRLANAR